MPLHFFWKKFPLILISTHFHFFLFFFFSFHFYFRIFPHFHIISAIKSNPSP